jgi:hypothetical protein
MTDSAISSNRLPGKQELAARLREAKYVIDPVRLQVVDLAFQTAWMESRDSEGLLRDPASLLAD